MDQYDDSVHGVQKDAIQNGIDAVPPNKKNRDGTIGADYLKDKWRFVFELTEIYPPGGRSIEVLTMTDYGTTGLIGEKRVGDFENSDEEIPRDEKWARFESYAVANIGAQTLGARGQGKFVFIGSSKKSEMVYDTRKITGGYRVGRTTVTRTTSPVEARDELEGEKWIMDQYGIEPVHSDGNTGTRIIIIDPSEELKERVRSGKFLSHICETWWPLIKYYDAKIEVIVDGVRSVATVPDEIEIFKSTIDSEKIKFWIKDGLQFNFGSAREIYTIKEFRIASIEAGVPEEFRGIAVFRGNMKVKSVQVNFGLEFETRITGYVILEAKGDEKLREIEMPNHYEFRPTGIWKKLETAIKEQAQSFGANKLGIGISASANSQEKRSATISRALQIFKFLSKDWPIDLASHGIINPPIINPPPTSIKLRYVSIKNIVFPNPGNVARLDWGQKLSDWWIEIGNKKSSKIKIKLECWISSSSSKLLDIIDHEVLLHSQSTVTKKGEDDCGYEFPVNKELFADAGKYQLHARITDLSNKVIIDEVVRSFWVEADPPLQAPFEIQPLSFQQQIPDDVELEWKMDFRDNGYTVYYNTDHPSFSQASELGADSLYIGEVASMAGLQLVIRNVSGPDKPDEKILKKLPFKYDDMFGDDAEKRYLETMKVRQVIRHKIYSNFV